MTGAHRLGSERPPAGGPTELERAEQELDRDRRRERTLSWKGVFAVAVTAGVAFVRQRYFV